MYACAETGNSQGNTKMFNSTFSASSSTAAPWSANSSLRLGVPRSESCSTFPSRAQTSPGQHRPVGDMWRSTGDWSPERSFAGAGDSFIGGAVPFWPKGRMCRSKGHIAHDLSWAYWRMRRHPDHPLRIAVGQQNLPTADVCSALRDKTQNGFNFWRDLRPPFQVISVRRLDSSVPQGEQYVVTYECDVDFGTEHCNTAMRQEGGTFDVKIHGEATVILPDKYPETRSIQILDWGTPKMNWTPGPDDQQEGQDHRPTWEIWQPLAKELNERPTARRFQNIQVPDNLKRKTCAKTSDVRTDPISKVLLGRHDFNKLHKSMLANAASRKNIVNKNGSVRSFSESPGTVAEKKPRRRHIVFTAAAGFVPYEG